MTSDFRTSSFCDAGACVEVRQDGPVVELRATTDPDQVVQVTADMWRDLIRGIQVGDLQ